MIALPNGCKCSEMKVNPKNWDTSKVSLKKDWLIYYRFYDPLKKEQYPKGKLRIIKGMNACKILEERQAAVRALIELELRELKNFGFNPISRRHVSPPTKNNLPSSDTPFIEALLWVLNKAQYASGTKSDLRSVIKYLKEAAVLLNFDYLPVKELRTSHIIQLLEQCRTLKKTWNSKTFNAYVKYLSLLFAQLVQHQIADINPVTGIKKKKTVKELRKILSQEECRTIDAFAKAFDKNLWRFIHIFFHSGSRTTEILRVKGEHVDLKNQKVKYLVLKGQQPEWIERTIKDISLPLWEEAVKNCRTEEYVFSRGLKPGALSIRPEQICRRWRTHIKKKLGIECDFYSLKHLNTDQTSEQIDLKTASIHNGHKSTDITKIYAVNEKERTHQKIKGIGNQFAVNVKNINHFKSAK